MGSFLGFSFSSIPSEMPPSFDTLHKGIQEIAANQDPWPTDPALIFKVSQGALSTVKSTARYYSSGIVPKQIGFDYYVESGVFATGVGTNGQAKIISVHTITNGAGDQGNAEIVIQSVRTNVFDVAVAGNSRGVDEVSSPITSILKAAGAPTIGELEQHGGDSIKGPRAVTLAEELMKLLVEHRDDRVYPH